MVMGSGGVVMTDGIDERATVVEKWLWHIAKRLLSPALIFEYVLHAQKKKKKRPPYLPIFLLGFSHRLSSFHKNRSNFYFRCSKL